MIFGWVWLLILFDGFVVVIEDMIESIFIEVVCIVDCYFVLLNDIVDV